MRLRSRPNKPAHGREWRDPEKLVRKVHDADLVGPKRRLRSTNPHPYPFAPGLSVNLSSSSSISNFVVSSPFPPRLPLQPLASIRFSSASPSHGHLPAPASRRLPSPLLTAPIHPPTVGRQATLAPPIRRSGEMPVGPIAAAVYGEQG